MTKFLTNFSNIYIKKPLMCCWLFIIRSGQKVNYRMIGIMQSYCPISNQIKMLLTLISTMSKVMEKLVTNRLQWFVEKNNLLSNSQSDFRKKQKYYGSNS